MKQLPITILLILILFQVGCQATPEQSPVIGKWADFLDSVEETEFQPYKAPQSVKAHESLNSLDISIDASVIIPVTNAYSIMIVSKETFDKEILENVMSYFHPNGVWVKEVVLTKTDIIRKMAEINDNKDLEYDRVQNHLQRLQEYLKEAPEIASLEPFVFEDVDEETTVSAYCKENNHYAVLACELNGSTYQYRRDIDEIWVREENVETDQEKKDFLVMDSNITVDYALSVATQAMSNLNVDSSMLLSYYCKAISYQNYKAKSAGWEFCFTRDCNGLQSVFVSDWAQWIGSPDPINAAPWGQEFIFITVDDNGIAKFDIRNAGRYSKVIINNTKLMGFENILERIKQQLVYNHAYQPDDILEYSVEVNEIKLCSSLINAKDDFSIGRMIPTWDISYTFSERYSNEYPATIHNCHIFLNAIDGSYIEPRASIDVWMQ